MKQFDVSNKKQNIRFFLLRCSIDSVVRYDLLLTNSKIDIFLIRIFDFSFISILGLMIKFSYVNLLRKLILVSTSTALIFRNTKYIKITYKIWQFF